MAVYLTLAQCKQHLLVDSTFTDDDSYITALMDVAEAAVERHLDRPLPTLAGASGSLPAPVTHAMLLIVGNLYANREPAVMASVNKVPYTLEYLIGLYQKHNIG